ncbi:hypothetical protein COU57_00350 [Candidatus Pacearchaeota archaeon CG10_big_fil_rev_8_21_14_0_10_32_14]|nr:MAG: hypothetical protein COU57_00350 [Candidatus Pacearchaeota archaeon CG10_big_fil_rev_8_21_14_0_10_32_14]
MVVISQQYLFDNPLGPLEIRNLLYGTGSKSIYGLFLIKNMEGSYLLDSGQLIRNGTHTFSV